MAKKKPVDVSTAPMISSMSMRIKAEVNNQTIPTADKTKTRKEKLLSILDSAAQNFETNLTNGTVKITSLADLERIAKLTLTLSGETTDIKSNQVIEATGVSSNIPEGVIQLDTEDANVKAVYQMLYGQMNEENDKK